MSIKICDNCKKEFDLNVWYGHSKGWICTSCATSLYHQANAYHIKEISSLKAENAELKKRTRLDRLACQNAHAALKRREATIHKRNDLIRHLRAELQSIRDMGLTCPKCKETTYYFKHE